MTNYVIFHLMVNAVIFQQKTISKWNGPVSQGFNIPSAPTSSERQFPFNCRVPLTVHTDMQHVCNSIRVY